LTGGDQVGPLEDVDVLVDDTGNPDKDVVIDGD
jgi:hypothetical protein